MTVLTSDEKLNDNIGLLKSRASKLAYQGVILALCTVIIATLLTCLMHYNEISVEAIIYVQKTNFALWILDAVYGSKI